MAAVGGAVGRPVSEEDWNTQGMEGWEEAPALAYNFAKAEGERTVWAETEGKPYSVSAINPCVVTLHTFHASIYSRCKSIHSSGNLGLFWIYLCSKWSVRSVLHLF
eukprot:COSAG06_NODE_14249_length_1175_cov_0.964684_2_plen_106_part_00